MNVILYVMASVVGFAAAFGPFTDQGIWVGVYISLALLVAGWLYEFVGWARK